MWNCPKCIKPQTLLDQALQFKDLWQQVYYVPYTQIYQYTAVCYRGLEIGLFYNNKKSRITIIRIEPVKVETLECQCGATLDVPKTTAGAVFFIGLQFFKQELQLLPAPRIKSCETLVQFTEESHTHTREAVVRDYVLRHVRRSYLDKRGEEKWLLWYRP